MQLQVIDSIEWAEKLRKVCLPVTDVFDHICRYYIVINVRIYKILQNNMYNSDFGYPLPDYNTILNL